MPMMSDGGLLSGRPAAAASAAGPGEPAAAAWAGAWSGKAAPAAGAGHGAAGDLLASRADTASRLVPDAREHELPLVVMGRAAVHADRGFAALAVHTDDAARLIAAAAGLSRGNRAIDFADGGGLAGDVKLRLLPAECGYIPGLHALPRWD